MSSQSIICRPSFNDYQVWIKTVRALRKVKARHIYFLIVSGIFTVIFLDAYIGHQDKFNLIAMIAFLAIFIYHIYDLYALKGRVVKAYQDLTKEYQVTLADSHLEILGNNNLRRVEYTAIRHIHQASQNTIIEFADPQQKKLQSVLIPDSSFKTQDDKKAFLDILNSKQSAQ